MSEQGAMASIVLVNKLLLLLLDACYLVAIPVSIRERLVDVSNIYAEIISYVVRLTISLFDGIVDTPNLDTRPLHARVSRPYIG